ncbi:hypothetical protein [Glutamicibacter endophyticus]|uniref:hypothetical protein n=1 Tax=Glutamicibacter endophyticus TaxID=1522174 RepID=UPI003AEF4741
MPAAVAEHTTAEEYLEASIERFLATRPAFTDEMRDRLGAALRPQQSNAEPAIRISKAA